MDRIFSFIKDDVLKARIDHDLRDEIFLFNSIPWLGIDQTVGLRLPSLWFWLQVVVNFVLQTCFTALCGLIVYKVIIPNRKSQLAYLTGYGIVIPLLLFYPSYCVELLEIRNRFIQFFCALTSVLALFRTSAAMYGFSPSGSESSLQTYLLSYATLGEVIFDPSTNLLAPPVSNPIITFAKFFVGIWSLGLYSSFLSSYNFEFYDTGIPMNSLDHSISDMISFPHLTNNFLIAVLLQSYLMVFSLPLRLAVNILFKIDVKDFMDNAMFTATSPSDFWGSKWNLLVHGVLKRGVYKPVRTYYSSTVATICTFFASGLFHEWLLSVVFHVHEKDKDENGQCESCFYPSMYGGQMIFFVWNGVTISIEVFVKKYLPMVHQMFKRLPRFCMTTMTIMSALPLAHVFFGEIMACGYFSQCQISLPILVLMDDNMRK